MILHRKVHPCLNNPINPKIPLSQQWCSDCFNQLKNKMFDDKTTIMMFNYMRLSLHIKDIEYLEELHLKCLKKICNHLSSFKSTKLVNNTMGTNIPYKMMSWIQRVIRNQYITMQKKKSKEIKAVPFAFGDKMHEKFINQFASSNDDIEQDIMDDEKNQNLLNQVTKLHRGKQRNMDIVKLKACGYSKKQIEKKSGIRYSTVHNVLYKTEKFLGSTLPKNTAV